MIDEVVYALVIFSSMLGAVGQMLFKVGSGRITGLNMQSLMNLPLIGGLALYGAATILYILMLRNGNLSVLYPLIAFSYLWVALLSYFVLKEPVSIVNFIGFALIIVGVGLAVHR